MIRRDCVAQHLIALAEALDVAEQPEMAGNRHGVGLRFRVRGLFLRTQAMSSVGTRARSPDAVLPPDRFGSKARRLEGYHRHSRYGERHHGGGDPAEHSQPITHGKTAPDVGREAISIVPAITETAFTPLSTAAQHSALTGSILAKLIVMPTRWPARRRRRRPWLPEGGGRRPPTTYAPHRQGDGRTRQHWDGKPARADDPEGERLEGA
ncbi:hypothetical protein MicloDRAFT_00014180 [Microvirga lotononidis]|uniref:Uncharacterized protein n=1 Tax=Microvirga lotononidis TaxID=864069 RepID=I4Z1K5_9HYPH|nr:hypothetical protein MicloDRAFT_00014180 [Microvirga lotononidis]